MDETWEKWLLDWEIDDECTLFSESKMNSLEEDQFMNNIGEKYSQPHQLSWETNTHYSDSNFTTQTTAVAAEEANYNKNFSLKEHASSSSEKPCRLSSSMSYVLSFEDSTAVPNSTSPKETCQNDAKPMETQEEVDNRKSKRGRSSSQIQDHTIAERRRRENLTKMFIALSATIPGLKKMDKASIINNAIDYVKYLQKRVRDLEEQCNKRRKIEPVVCFKNNKSNGTTTVIDDFSLSSDGLHRPIKAFPDVKASISAKDVFIRVICEKQKNIVTMLLGKLEAHNLSIVCSNVLPFGNSILTITIVAQFPSGPTLGNDQYVQAIRWKLQSYHTEFVHLYEPSKILLPMLFSLDWYDKISSNVLLIDPVGNQFEVMVKKGKSRVLLTQGTERIGEYYKLYHGGWMTFIYINERTMVMEVRDSLGEQVVYPTPARSFHLGSASNPINLEGPNVTSLPPSIVLQHEGCFHHAWIKTLSEVDVSTDALNMAGGFVKLAFKRTNTHIHVVDEFGKAWPCKLMWETDSAYKCKLTSGWLNFCKGRGLKAGTTISFGIPKDANEQIYFKLA